MHPMNILHLASYPMPYVHEQASQFDASVIGIVFVLLFIAAGLSLFYWLGACDEAEKLSHLIGTGILTLVLIGATAATGFYGYSLSTTNLEASDAARTAYDNTVIEWMDTEYGVTIDADALSRLTDGKTLVVVYQGNDTLIQFVERADKGLAVRVPDGALLQPVG